MKVFFGIFQTMVLVSLPALISVWGCYNLIHWGLADQNLFAWVLLFFCMPFTLLFTLLALVVNSLSLFGLLMLVSGRKNSHFRVFTGSHQDLRDVFQRAPPRDVTPIEPRQIN
jgi:hypothetical protein